MEKIYTFENRTEAKEFISDPLGGYFSDSLDFTPYYEGFLNDVYDDPEYPFEASVEDFENLHYFRYFSPEKPIRETKGT